MSPPERAATRQRLDSNSRPVRQRGEDDPEALPRADVAGFTALFLQPAMASLSVPRPRDGGRGGAGNIALAPVSRASSAVRRSPPSEVLGPRGTAAARQKSGAGGQGLQTVSSGGKSGRAHGVSREDAAAPRSANDAGVRCLKNEPGDSAWGPRAAGASLSARTETRKSNHAHSAGDTGPSPLGIEGELSPGGAKPVADIAAAPPDDGSLRQAPPAGSAEETPGSEAGREASDGAVRGSPGSGRDEAVAGLSVPSISLPLEGLLPASAMEAPADEVAGTKTISGEASPVLETLQAKADPNFGTAVPGDASPAARASQRAVSGETGVMDVGGEGFQEEAAKPSIRVAVERTGLGRGEDGEHAASQPDHAVETGGILGIAGGERRGVSTAARAQGEALPGGQDAARVQAAMALAARITREAAIESAAVSMEGGEPSAEAASVHQGVASSFAGGAADYGSAQGPETAWEAEIPRAAAADSDSAGNEEEEASSSSENGISGARLFSNAGGASDGNSQSSLLSETPPRTFSQAVVGMAFAGASRRQGGQLSPPNPSSRVGEALEPALPPGRTSDLSGRVHAARSLRIDLPGVAGGESLRLRFLQRGNTHAGGAGSGIDVRIQSSSERVVRELRAEIPALLGRLERAGFEAGLRTAAGGAGEHEGARDSSPSGRDDGRSDGGGGWNSGGEHSAGRNAEDTRRQTAPARAVQRSAAGAAFAGNLTRALHRHQEAGKSPGAPDGGSGISAPSATDR